MNGKLEVSARGIALDLLRGATAEVVGHKYLAGFSPSYMEIDGVPVQLPPPKMKEAPAVRVTYLDGFTALYLAADEERAESLLARANEIAEVHLGR